MTDTEKLLRLHQVDSQLRGLQHRIANAERYLKQQETRLSELSLQKDALEGQLRQLKASCHNDETESTQCEEKIAKLRKEIETAEPLPERQWLLKQLNEI